MTQDVTNADVAFVAGAEEPAVALNELTTETEVPAAPSATEVHEAATEPEVDDEQAKRIARLAIDARDARRKTRALEAEIAVLKGQRQEAPDEELDRRVAERAEQIASAKLFTDRCNAIYQSGVKEFGEGFKTAIGSLNDALGSLPVVMIEAAEDAGDPVKLLNYLGENIDIAEHLAGLSAHRMGVELTKLASKLATPKVKPVSKAPKPSQTVTGNAAAESDPAKMSIADYMKYEDARQMERMRS